MSNETHGLMSPEEIAVRRREEFDHAQSRREWGDEPAPPSLWPLLTLAILGLLVAIAVFMLRY